MAVIVTNGNATLSTVVTMTIASPCVVTLGVVDATTGLAQAPQVEGAPIVFATTGALPTGVTAGTTYYVRNPSTNTFNISATVDGALIDTSGTQSGVHTKANSFTKAIAYNISGSATTTLSLSSTRTIGFTPSDASNVKGAILTIISRSATITRSITCTLQQYSGGSWADVSGATCTLTPDQIATTGIMSGSGYMLSFIAYFPFTTPAAVTTDASTWRLSISEGSGTNVWYLVTSDNTNPAYIVVSDVNATPTTTADCVVAKDYCIIDKDFTFAAYLPTGQTTYNVAAISCSNQTDITADNVSYFLWENPAAGAYTINCPGGFVLPSHSGLRIGTSDNRISNGTWNFTAPSVGTLSRFIGAFQGLYYENRHSLFLYGTIPTCQRTTLASDAASGQAHIITTDTTGWSIGDTVWVGGQDALPRTDTTTRTISNISGTDITLDSNLSVKRLGAGNCFGDGTGATVIRTNGYGIKLTSPSSTSSVYRHFIGGLPNHFQISGCELQSFALTRYSLPPSGVSAYDSTKTSQAFMTDCSVRPLADTSNYGAPFYQFVSNSKGLLIQRVNSLSGFCYIAEYGAGFTGTTEIKDCYQQSYVTNYGQSNGYLGNLSKIIYDNNYFDSIHITANPASVVNLNGVGTEFTDNKMYGLNNGGSSSWGNIRVGTLINGIISGNYYDRCSCLYSLYGPIINTNDSDSFFGDVVANTYDIYFEQGSYFDFIIKDPTNNLTIDTTNLTTTVDGSKLGVNNYNVTSNDDRNWLTYGYLIRTGYGLADTKVWNGTAFAAAAAGQFGMRLQPTSSASNLVYEDNNGTTTIGNCQNLPVSVSLRIKINSATYYAGTHTLPTLRVTYDGSTQVTDVATALTDDQQLQVNFTPTTTTSAIKIELLGATDASGSDAYIYLGENVVITAGGVLVDTTRFGSWVNAWPLGTFRTFPSPSSVWDELSSSHTVGGSMASKVKGVYNEVV